MLPEIQPSSPHPPMMLHGDAINHLYSPWRTATRPKVCVKQSHAGMFLFTFCLDRSQIISPVLVDGRQQRCLSPFKPRSRRVPKGLELLLRPVQVTLSPLACLWCGCEAQGQAAALFLDLTQRNEQCHRETSGTNVWLKSLSPQNHHFCRGNSRGKTQISPGPPPSQGSNWWAWQPLNKYFWCREFTCQLGGAPRGNFQSRSVGDNDTAQGSPP